MVMESGGEGSLPGQWRDLGIFKGRTTGVRPLAHLNVPVSRLADHEVTVHMPLFSPNGAPCWLCMLSWLSALIAMLLISQFDQLGF